MTTVPDELKAARHRANLTQTQVAAMAQIKDTTYTDIERGRRNPRLDTLQLVCGVLGLRVALVAAETESEESNG